VKKRRLEESVPLTLSSIYHTPAIWAKLLVGHEKSSRNLFSPFFMKALSRENLVYRVIHLKWQKVLNFYPQIDYFTGLELFLYCLMFFVSEFQWSKSNSLAATSN